MKEIIAITSRKGGCGKTTTAQALAAELKANGQRVLLLDLDSQCNLSAAMGADLGEYNATQLLEGKSADKVIQHTNNGDIIAGSKYLAGADLVLNNNRQLKKALAPILQDYDYIVIDTPASYGRLTTNALAAATSVIIPVRASSFDLQGMEEQADTIADIKEANKDLKIRGIILTQYDGRPNNAKKMLEEFKGAAEEMQTKVLMPPIRNCVKVSEAQGARKNLNEYAANCTSAADYKEIVQQILNNWK